MKNILFSILFYFMIYNVSVMPDTSSPNPLNDWKYFMDIQANGRSSYKAVFFNETVYEKALENFADIRIVDNQNNFVPYYVQNSTYKKKANILRYPAELTVDYTLAKDYFYEYKIISQKNTDILVNKIVFYVPEVKYSKTIQISGSYDGIFWYFITTDSIYQISDFKKTEISLKDEYDYRYYQIKVINSPLNIHIDEIDIMYDENEAKKNSYETIYSNYTITHLNNETRIAIPFKNIGRLKIRSLELAVQGNYNRSYEVFTINEDGTRKLYDTGTIYSIQFLNSTISNSIIGLKAPLASRPLEIVIKNKDDRPLDIRNIKVKYLADKVVFVTNGSLSYRLYFGNPNAIKPAYDLELFKNLTELEYQNVCKLSQLSNSQNPKKQSFLDGFISLIDLVVIQMKKLLIRQ